MTFLIKARFNEISNPDHKDYRKFMTSEEVSALVDPGMEIKAPVLEWLQSEPVTLYLPFAFSTFSLCFSSLCFLSQ